MQADYQGLLRRLIDNIGDTKLWENDDVADMSYQAPLETMCRAIVKQPGSLYKKWFAQEMDVSAVQSRKWMLRALWEHAASLPDYAAIRHKVSSRIAAFLCEHYQTLCAVVDDELRRYGYSVLRCLDEYKTVLADGGKQANPLPTTATEASEPPPQASPTKSALGLATLAKVRHASRDLASGRAWFGPTPASISQLMGKRWQMWRTSLDVALLVAAATTLPSQKDSSRMALKALAAQPASLTTATNDEQIKAIAEALSVRIVVLQTGKSVQAFDFAPHAIMCAHKSVVLLDTADKHYALLAIADAETSKHVQYCSDDSDLAVAALNKLTKRQDPVMQFSAFEPIVAEGINTLEDQQTGLREQYDPAQGPFAKYAAIYRLWRRCLTTRSRFFDLDVSGAVHESTRFGWLPPGVVMQDSGQSCTLFGSIRLELVDFCGDQTVMLREALSVWTKGPQHVLVKRKAQELLDLGMSMPEIHRLTVDAFRRHHWLPPNVQPIFELPRSSGNIGQNAAERRWRHGGAFQHCITGFRCRGSGMCLFPSALDAANRDKWFRPSERDTYSSLELCLLAIHFYGGNQTLAAVTALVYSDWAELEANKHGRGQSSVVPLNATAMRDAIRCHGLALHIAPSFMAKYHGDECFNFDQDLHQHESEVVWVCTLFALRKKVSFGVEKDNAGWSFQRLEQHDDISCIPTRQALMETTVIPSPTMQDDDVPNAEAMMYFLGTWPQPDADQVDPGSQHDAGSWSHLYAWCVHLLQGMHNNTRAYDGSVLSSRAQSNGFGCVVKNVQQQTTRLVLNMSHVATIMRLCYPKCDVATTPESLPVQEFDIKIVQSPDQSPDEAEVPDATAEQPSWPWTVMLGQLLAIALSRTSPSENKFVCRILTCALDCVSTSDLWTGPASFILRQDQSLDKNHALAVAKLLTFAKYLEHMNRSDLRCLWANIRERSAVHIGIHAATGLIGEEESIGSVEDFSRMLLQWIGVQQPIHANRTQQICRNKALCAMWCFIDNDLATSGASNQ